MLREGTSILRALFSVFFPSDASWGFRLAPRSLQGTLRGTTWGPCVQQGSDKVICMTHHVAQWRQQTCPQLLQ